MESLFRKLSRLKVVVLGDVMLDTYWWGNVERISPEAPVPVVALHKKEVRIGGAGNVALNTVALGAETFIVSFLGEDNDGNELQQLFQQNKINTDYLLSSDNRITTNKTRILSRNQQMMRLDGETTKDISTFKEENLLQKLNELFVKHQPDVLIFEDYNKGVLTKNLIVKVIGLCKKSNVITTVDPKRKNFFAFQGVDIFKPNLKEVKDGLNLLIDDVNENSLQQIHAALQEKLHHQISFITLSEKGVYFQSPSEHKLIPTHVRSIADVSGAGDTAIATASLVYAATKNMLLAAEIANIAAGLVCEEVGTAAIDKEKLLHECKVLLSEPRF